MGQVDHQESSAFLLLNFWQAVISHESSFIQFSYSAHVWVWRSADEEFWMNGLQPTAKYDGLSLKVWGVIWHDGKCKLTVCDSGIHSAKYMEILEEALLLIFAIIHVNKNQHFLVKDDAPCNSA